VPAIERIFLVLLGLLHLDAERFDLIGHVVSRIAPEGHISEHSALGIAEPFIVSINDALQLLLGLLASSGEIEQVANISEWIRIACD